MTSVTIEAKFVTRNGQLEKIWIKAQLKKRLPFPIDQFNTVAPNPQRAFFEPADALPPYSVLQV